MRAHAPFAIGRLILDEMDRQQLSRIGLVRRLGYSNIAKGLRRLDRLLETGFEPSLMTKIAGALFIGQNIIDDAMLETEAEIARERNDARQRDDDRERSNFRPYILIQTEGNSRPRLFDALLYERLKHILVPRSILGELLIDQIAWVSRTVVAHYVSACGVVEGYGEITGYFFRRNPQDTIHFEATEGRIMNYFALPPIEIRPRPGSTGHRIVARTNRSDSRPAAPPLLSVADDNLSAP